MKSKDAILATITYSDIFDCPLTLPEIHKYFQGERKTSQDDIKKELFQVTEIESSAEYFFLEGRKEIVVKKRFRLLESRKKIQKAKTISRILARIPTVQLVAVSGSLATENAGHDDDIDLFIVTRTNTVWITRFLINVLLIAFFQKRKKNVRSARNKICPNMILSEDALTIPPRVRTLYTAREVVQLYPIIDKNQTYARLLHANRWIQSILPNVMIEADHTQENEKHTRLLNLLDDIFFRAQKKYMKITNETVTKKVAKFHPRKTGAIVLDLYEKRLAAVLGQEEAKRVIHQQDILAYKRKE